MTVANHAAQQRTGSEALAAPLRTALRHPWVESMVCLAAVEYALRALHPMLSITEVRTRVVRIVDETADTKTFVLQPNALWQGERSAKAGQFVQLRLEIDGRRVERIYSLSSRPGARLIGITPVMAMLRDLQARKYPGDVVFLHVCRNPDELIFATALQGMGKSVPELSLLIHFDGAAGPFTAEALQYAVPDLAERSTWMCGPGGFMDLVHRHWHANAINAPLHSERFVAVPLRPTTAPGTPVTAMLAPDMPAHRSPEVAPKIQALCEKYGLLCNTGSLFKQYLTVMQRILTHTLPPRRVMPAPV